MRPVACALALVVAGRAAPAFAQPEAPARPAAPAFAQPEAPARPAAGAEGEWSGSPRDAAGAAGVALRSRFGVASAPFAAPSFPTVKGFGVASTLSAYARVGDDLWFGARVAGVTASVEQPAGSYLREAAWANPELWIERHARLSPFVRVNLKASAGLPFAESGPARALFENRALAAGSALEAGLEQGAFTPGVVPIGVAGRVDFIKAPWVASVGVRLPAFVRHSDAGLPDGARARAFGFAPSAMLRAAYWPGRHFGLSLAGHLVVDVARVADPARGGERDGRVQPVVEAGLHVPVGERLYVGVEGGGPVGGALRGTFALGLNAGVRF
jgi:hypothetical protein